MIRPNGLAAVISAMTVAALVGCTNASSPGAAPSSSSSATVVATDLKSGTDRPKAKSFVGPASARLDVGESADLVVGVHCGLRYARVDGSMWQVVRSDRAHRGGGAMPLIEGVATRTASDVVIFESSSLQDEVTLRPVRQPRNYVCF